MCFLRGSSTLLWLVAIAPGVPASGLAVLPHADSDERGQPDGTTASFAEDMTPEGRG